MNLLLKAGALAIAGTMMLSSTVASAQCRDGRNRHVVVINNTRTVLRELYGSRVTTNSWEEDVLGSRVLAPGQRIDVNFDDGTCACNFDFKAVFADGEEVIRRNYNVCTGSSWTITGN